jgi:polyphenol oxidase
MIKRIEPAIFSYDSVTALFTESNRDNIHPGRTIPGLDLGFNTDSGEDVIRQNYNFLADVLGIEPLNIALSRQVHATSIKEVSKAGLYTDTDGLITAVPGLALGIQVADCAAVLVADTKQGVIGAFHAGWRGAAGGIIPKGLQRMKKLGADTSVMKAFISPCISLKNFEVGEEVSRQFPEEFCDYKSYKKPHVDLKAFIRYQLEKEGIPDNRIETASECTMEDERFYSYRRERERAGRMLALIQLKI